MTRIKFKWRCTHHRFFYVACERVWWTLVKSYFLIKGKSLLALRIIYGVYFHWGRYIYKSVAGFMIIIIKISKSILSTQICVRGCNMLIVSYFNFLSFRYLLFRSSCIFNYIVNLWNLVRKYWLIFWLCIIFWFLFRYINIVSRFCDCWVMKGLICLVRMTKLPWSNFNWFNSPCLLLDLEIMP